MEYNLNGKTAIITGATGGIGSAITTELYKAGANLVLTGRDIKKLENLSAKLCEADDGTNKTKKRITFLPLDLTAIEAEETLVKHAVNMFNRIDILVNNAALIEGKLFLKTDDKFLAKIMQINFIAPYRLMQQTLPYMLKNKFGRIINITSIAGNAGDAGLSAYSASKGALSSASKAVATEYGRRGITVNCIAPGLIETEAIKIISNEYIKDIKKQIPMRRFGKPDEIASLVAYLASEKSAYINGQIINVNGGLLR